MEGVEGPAPLPQRPKRPKSAQRRPGAEWLMQSCKASAAAARSEGAAGLSREGRKGPFAFAA